MSYKVIKKKSDTVIIVVHEIYGINQHIEDVCQSLRRLNFDVICPNLLETETPYDYSQEKAAYENFMKNVGLINAANKIKRLISVIKSDYQKVFILGFSVGATIAWLCSEDTSVNGIVGYYGSRIRNYLGISPQCPTLLIFPQDEVSFEVNELILTLDKDKIDIYKAIGKHGFSDPYSSMYNSESAQISFNKMVGFLKKYR